VRFTTCREASEPSRPGRGMSTCMVPGGSTSDWLALMLSLAGV
jgi:hypothetical protein